MTDKTLTYQDVREIIKLVEEADKFGEFRLRYNDIEISLSKHAPLSDVATQAQRSAPLPSLPLRARNQRRKRRSVLPRQIERGGGKRRQCRKEWPAHFVTVRAPMVGTLLRAGTGRETLCRRRRHDCRARNGVHH